MEAWLVALIYFLVTMVGFYIIKKIIISRIKREDGDQTRFSAFATGIGEFISFPLVFIFAVWIASLNLILPAIFNESIYFVVIAVTAYYLMKGGLAMMEYLLLLTEKQTGQDYIVNFLRFVMRTIIFIFVLLWFLDTIGVPITTFLAGFGILGLGFAFALQNVLADLFASITIYLDRPFDMGDTIKVGTDIGKVEKIGLRSTHLRTPLGNQLIISNRDLSTQRIHNMKRMETRQVELILGVSAETSHDVLELIPEMIKEIVESYDQTEFAWAYFTEFGDFSLKYKVIYRITTADAMVWLKTQQAVNLAILRRFDEEGIELPYPIQKVIVEEQA